MVVGKWAHNWKKLKKNLMLRRYLVFEAHKNNIPIAIPLMSRLNFSMAIIFTSPSFTLDINMADKSGSNFSLAGVTYIPAM